jgi:hypothetical protein
VADESPELFDDIYLGLRAGGAARKQRRGEPLSVEEKEAIGRWQRLSLWRRFIAIGAFALGTFGLGFTVGGLIFGRWRTARRLGRLGRPRPRSGRFRDLARADAPR